LAEAVTAPNSSALPFDRSWAHRWVVSVSFNIVTGVGLPPSAETRQIPEPTVGVKRIVPSLSQLGVAPAAPCRSEMVTGSPPVRSTFFSFPKLKNPTH
jgi:hypothetical protein